MRKMTPAMKKLDKKVSEACQRLTVDYQINIMNLSDIHNAGMAAALLNEDIDAAVLTAIQKYGKPTSV